MNDFLKQVLEKIDICCKNGNNHVIKDAMHHVETLIQFKRQGIPVATKDNFGFIDEESYRKYMETMTFLVFTLQYSNKDLNKSSKGCDYQQDYVTPPLNIFHDSNRNAAKQAFMNARNITLGQVLDCMVMKELNDKYELLVLKKYGDSKKLDGLGLHAFLTKQKIKADLQPLVKLLTVLRVSCCGFKTGDDGEKIIIVQLMTNKIRNIALGILDQIHPEYRESIDRTSCRSLTDYIAKNPALRNQAIINSKLQTLGIDSHQVNSVYEKLNGKPVSQDAKVTDEENKIKSLDFVSNKALSKLTFGNSFEVHKKAMKEKRKKIIENMKDKTFQKLSSSNSSFTRQDYIRNMKQSSQNNETTAVRKVGAFGAKAALQCLNNNSSERAVEYLNVVFNKLQVIQDNKLQKTLDDIKVEIFE